MVVILRFNFCLRAGFDWCVERVSSRKKVIQLLFLMQIFVNWLFVYVWIRLVQSHWHLSLRLTNQQKNTLWRLHTSILNDKIGQKQIQQEFETYLQNNNNGEVTLYGSQQRQLCEVKLLPSQKEEKQARLVKLQESLELRHMKQKDPQILTRIKKLKQDINGIYD